MKQIVTAYAIFLTSVITAEAYAEPDKNTLYLMNEPVSLLTWGMHKIDMRLDQIFDEYDLPARTSYNYKLDRITIDIGIGNDVVPTKSKCRYFIKRIRIAGGIDWETGEPFNEQHWPFAYEFEQSYINNYKNTDRPDNFDKDISEKFRIKVSLYGENSAGDKELMICHGDLLDNRVVFP